MPQLIQPLVLKSINPSSFKVGEALFNIQIKNQGDEILTNLIPLISGKGFSVSDIIPINILHPKTTGYILVSGSFSSAGETQLIIRLYDQLFYYNVTVSSNVQETTVSDLLLTNLSSKLDLLKQDYSQLSTQLTEKTNTGYDTTSISLTEAKRYIRDTEAFLFVNYSAINR